MLLLQKFYLLSSFLTMSFAHHLLMKTAQEWSFVMIFYPRYSAEEKRIIKEIRATQMALETAYSGFENVIEPDLIDSYIYEMNAMQLRYKVLIQTAKMLRAGKEKHPVKLTQTHSISRKFAPKFILTKLM